MRYLTLNETLELYQQMMLQFGGTSGIQNVAALESALAHHGNLLAARICLADFGS